MKKVLSHLNTVNKHRFLVFKLCCRAGIPWRGFVHDLSKYSIIEFSESVKYYSGKHSPIRDCKKVNGYSKAWLHHKGRNKHHYEYWYDYAAPEATPVIPYKYAVESICDTLAAGIIYNGKDWTNSTQLEYWNNVLAKGHAKINKKIENFYTDIYTQVSKKGIKEVITPKNLKQTYNKHCEI